MISLADLIFLAGVACALAGCWMRSVPDFVVGLGVAACLAGVVIGKLAAAKRRGKR